MFQFCSILEGMRIARHRGVALTEKWRSFDAEKFHPNP
jgi:hypothetical protein